MSRFKCFKSPDGEIVVVDKDGKPCSVGDISSEIFEYIGSFEADGLGDFNWGVVEMVLKYKLTKSKAYKKAVRINRNGL